MNNATVTRDAWVLLVEPDTNDRTVTVNHNSRSAIRLLESADRPSESVFDGTVLSFFGIRFQELILPAGQGLWVRAVTNAIFVSATATKVRDAVGQSIGWADYVDDRYTSASRLSVPRNVDFALPNNGLGGVKAYAPEGIDLFADGKVTGREGEVLLLTQELTVQRDPNRTGEFDFETWLDIGGVIPPLFRRYYRIRGGGQERKIVSTTMVYTLDTWAANGAATMIRSSVDVHVWAMRTLVARVSVPDIPIPMS